MSCDCNNDCTPDWQAQITQGETFKFSLEPQDNAGAALNITGSVTTFVMKRNFDATATLTLTEGIGITTTANPGKIDGVISAAQTADLKGSYVGSLKIVLAGGETYVVPGQFTICRAA